jgi:DnaJ-class molecular chaperone
MAVEFKDYYRLLGVERSADEKTLKSAYRKLARKFHPDVSKGKDSAERFKEINEAYEVLSDPEKRRRYDTLGPDWQRYAQQAPPPGGEGGFRAEYGGDGGDFSEFFRTIFGDLGARTRGSRGGIDVEELLGRAGRGRRGRPRGEDVQASVEISFEDAYQGARRTFALDMDEPCSTCHGAGHVGGQPCTACHGAGWQRGHREVDVKIPAGVKSGQRVRVSGEGAGESGARGDLYLVVTVTPHPEFERQDDDILYTLSIGAPEAALGDSVEVPTLKGKVSMKVPPATSSGRVFRLRGYGMPRLRGGGFGDQLVRARIVMPGSLTIEEQNLYRQLKTLRSHDARGHA